MKTIFYYGIDNNKGGMEIYAFNLITNILKRTNEYHFHIISQYDDFAFKKELIDQYGCSFSIVPSRKKHPLKYSKEIKKILSNRKEKDILHLNLMSYRNFFLLHAVKKSKIETMIVGHSTNTNSIIDKIIHLIGRKLYKNLGTNVSNNELVTNYMFEKKANPRLIELGINKEKFYYNEKLNSGLIQKNSNFIIGNVGRISKEKNQIFLMKTMLLLKKHTDIHLYLCGNGNNPKILKYIKKHNLINVHFLGQIDNISDFYNNIDLFLFPSKFESAGFALYEALTNGCAAIISKNVPTTAIDLTNVKIRELKPSIWAKEILKFKDNKNSYIRRTNINACPSLENQVNKYLDLYNELTK